MRSFRLVIPLLLLTLAACSGIRVSQDYDTEKPFPSLTGYGWKETDGQKGDDIRENNPLLHKRIRDNIDRVLASKGYVRSERPDFLVDYTYRVSTRIESEPFSTGFGFGLGRYHRYGGFGIHSGSEIEQYEVGTLVIDISENPTDMLLWRGRGSDVVSPHPTPQESSEMVSRMVEAILEQFPPW